MSTTAVDSSVAVPLVHQGHQDHTAVSRWASGRVLALSGHAGVETYAVLTRLPGTMRLAPLDAGRLVRERFVRTLLLGPEASARLTQLLADLGIAGGAAYDALVALAAAEHGVVLATRDARALSTYRAVGVEVALTA